MREKAKKLLNNPLISGSAIVFIGTFIANLLSYLFNLFMGRFLSVSDYGILVTLTSIMALLGIFPTSFASVFAKFSAKYFARRDESSLTTLTTHGFKIISIFSFGFFILLMLSTIFLSSFLKIYDQRLFLFLFLTLFFYILYSLPAGILQGEMKFYLLSFFNVLSPFLRIILGIGFVLLGFKIFGVIVGTFLAFLIQFLIAFSYVIKGFKKTGEENISDKVFIKEFKDYSSKFLLASAGITILSNTDVILVRHFFDQITSGHYAALSLMGKSIFYLTSPIYFVFFPLIAYKKERNEKLTNTLLLAAGLITIVSTFLSFVYFLFPDIILKIFFPASEYRILIPYLGPFSLYILVFSLAYLLNTYFLSAGKTSIYKVNLLISFIMILAIFIFHNSLFQVIGILFFTSLLLLIFLFVYYYRENERN